MATKIVTKNSSTASAVPTASDLVQGELAVNVADKRLFTEDNGGSIVELGTNPSTIDINAGSIDGTAIGASSASTGAFTTLTATGLTVDTNTLYVDSTNNRVGIGTTSPSKTLVVNENDSECVAIIKSSDTGTAGLYLGGQTDEIKGGIVFDNSNNSLQLRGYNNAERMRIDSSGQVGIGTSSPSAKLDVKGAAARIRISDTDTSGTTGIEFVDSGGTKDAEIEVGNSSQYLDFKTNGSSRLTIEGSTVSTTGSIGVGRTSLSAATEDAGVVLSASGYIYSARNGTSNQSHIVFINNADVTATTAGSIKSSGSTTSYNTSSDYRLKTDAQPMTGATARLKALKPVNFEWIADGTRVDGFLAHEAQEVVPECVSGEKDAMQDQEYEVTPAVLDQEGNTVEEAVMGTRSVPDYQGIDQSKLVPLLVATIQELEARITQLENN